MSTSLVRRFTLATVGLVLAAVGLTAAVPAHAEEAPGTISGHLTDGGSPNSDSAGSPIPYTQVVLYDLDWGWHATTTTGEAGEFTLSDVPAGDYKLGFLLPGMVNQYAHQKLDFEAADIISVVAGAQTTVNEEVIPHGSLAGQVTTSTGEPAAFTYVLVYGGSQGYDLVGQTGADAEGRFRLPYMPPGTYRVEFRVGGELGPAQWAHQARSQDQAALIEVTAGARTTLDETLLPMGAIAGHLTDAGQPVPGAFVNLHDVDTGETFLAYTDEDGAYRVPAFPGTFKVEFRLSDDLVQWAHQKTTEESANTFVVTAGADTVVDEQLLPFGTVSGHLTDAGGNPVGGANVEISNEETFQYAYTDDTGAYQARVFPGQYRVRFSTDTQAQWAHGKTSAGAADLITVTGGQTAVVDDAMLVPGSLQVTATDSVTGAAISTFCVAANDAITVHACTTNGTATIDAAGPGTYELSTYIDADTDYQTHTTPGVQVRSGELTTVAVKLRRGATIKVTARDAKTGAPVANACLDLVLPDRPSTLGGGVRGCTDASGKVTVRPLDAGTVNPFIWARDGVHGHQWVGANGGVGKQAAAKQLTLRNGVTTSLTVNLDRSGAISGVITDKATHQPIEQAIASLASNNDGSGGSSGLTATDAHGRYTISDLGPYDWTLFFRKFGYASQWSGGGTNRLIADTVKVKVGRTTSYNVALRTGTKVTGKVVGRDGQPVQARIIAVNALTHDDMVSADTGPDGVYQMRVLGPQLVKLQWIAFDEDLDNQGWFRNAVDFAHATTVLIPADGTKTVNVPVPLH